jgi:hypothetical protein
VRFETALHRVLIERKSEILTERAETLARKATDLLALRLESERQTLRMARGQLAQAIAQFQTSTPAIEQKLEDSGLLLKHRIEDIPGIELRRVADETRARIMAALWPKVETTVRTARDRAPREVVHQLSGEMGKWVVDELRTYYPTTERHALRSLAGALEEHAERVQAAVGEVVTLANQLLGMQAAVPRVIPPTLDRPRFYFKEWDYSGGQLRGSTWRLWLPRRWAEPCALTGLHELLERRIHQNLEAVRYDWVLRLDDAVRRFQQFARQQLIAIIGVIREALGRAEHLETDGGVEVRISELDRQLEEVARIRSEFVVGIGQKPSPPTGASV